MRSSLLVDWKAHTTFLAVLVLMFYALFRIYNTLVDNTVTGMSTDDMMLQLGMYGFLKIMITLIIIAIVAGFTSAHSVYFLGQRYSLEAFLLHPVTDAELYAVVQTRSFLIAVFDALLAFGIAEILQWLISGSFPVDYYARTDWDYINSKHIIPSGVQPLLQKIICIGVVALFFCNAWFSLCATLFSRHPFIFGLLLLWVMTQFVSIGLFTVVGFSADVTKWVEQGIDRTEANYLISHLHIFVNWVIAIVVIATLVFWTASYIRIKKVAKAKYE